MHQPITTERTAIETPLCFSYTFFMDFFFLKNSGSVHAHMRNILKN